MLPKASMAAKFSWVLAACGVAAVIVGSPVVKIAGAVLFIGAIVFLSRRRNSGRASGDPGIPDPGQSGGGDGHGGSDVG